MSIRYFCETSYKIPCPRKTARWLKKVIAGERRNLSLIHFTFCDDNKLLEINTAFLKHKTLTDIITFDYGEGKTVSGEIFISLERVFENAHKFSVSEDAELRRVLVHGVLHLCGYADKSPADKKKMTARENFWLRAY
ncbi:MAG: rRNA maturation RNase YbeY [Candidatus Nephrothrix sp. EaCA]|nr:MAG: rRNA maturation RNase YbeY [Candidatus Nephrothrix sp. EaCA]